jgi:2-keto-4-pentenoate hydratase/2-oxohepta-3-ene-1,7-dioic acid hydratase in catechol pathway
MRIARFEHDGTILYGYVEDDGIRVAIGDPFSGLVSTETKLPLSAVKLLAPVVPGKAVCVGVNYRAHASEFGHEIPQSPILFIKPKTALIGPNDTIEYPAMSKHVDYEAELTVVIGKKARFVPAARAGEYILGYTCGNDVTARDLQPKDGQWTVAKSFDSFMPLGPWIVTDIDPSDLGLRAILNGKVKQDSRTSNLIFSVPKLVEYISTVMTLEPGDVIMTGTPSGVSPMRTGDEIIVEIENIGSLANRMG